MTKKWKAAIRRVLKVGPMKSGELVEKLGFDLRTTLFDVQTKFSNQLKPLNGSFDDSDAQRTLAEMVETGDVRWRRSANCDNWYALPKQRFPKEASSRKRTLKQLAAAVVDSLPKKIRIEMETANNRAFIHYLEAIDKEDVWVEIHPFVIQIQDDGWELADGDPVCNWCFNTFTQKYPMDVAPEKMTRRMVREWKTKHQKEFLKVRRA